jgi:hypothetical protein
VRFTKTETRPLPMHGWTKYSPPTLYQRFNCSAPKTHHPVLQQQLPLATIPRPRLIHMYDCDRTWPRGVLLSAQKDHSSILTRLWVVQNCPTGWSGMREMQPRLSLILHSGSSRHTFNTMMEPWSLWARQHIIQRRKPRTLPPIMHTSNSGKCDS